MGDGFEEDGIALPLPRALHQVDEVVPPSAELDLVLELVMAQALSADGVAHGVQDHGLELALVALVPTALLLRLLLGDLLQPDDALREALLELLGVAAQDRLENGDGRHKTVRGRGDGRELGVVGSDALVHVHRQVDLLAGAHLGDEDVGVGRADDVLAGKVLGLAALGNELDVLGVHVGVVVELLGVLAVRRRVLVVLALDLELELDRVVVAGRLALLVPLEEVVEALLAAGEGDQAKAVAENFVLDHRGVVPHEDVLDGQRGDVGDHDAAEGVGNGGVDANERELSLIWVVLVEHYTDVFAELFDVPGVVLAGVEAGEVGGCDIGDSLGVDMDRLEIRMPSVSFSLHAMRSAALTDP